MNLSNKMPKRHVIICLATFLLSLLQASIIIYRDLARELMYIASGSDSGLTLRFSHSLVYQELTKIDISPFIRSFLFYFSSLLIVQLGIALVYLTQNSKKARFLIALCFWLAPVIATLSTLVIPVAYLIISPFVAIFGYPLGFLGTSISKEMLVEGWIFPLAAVGWYHLFWLSISIKSLLSLRSQLERK